MEQIQALQDHQNPTTGQPASLPAASEAENLFWQSIMNSTNPTEFEAYLRRFPHGMFSKLAQIRLEVLRSTTVPAAGTPAWARRLGFRSPLTVGDDTSGWAQDGECDDPRFDGDGMASPVSFQSRGRDAVDLSPTI